jgi:hypothetical protein
MEVGHRMAGIRRMHCYRRAYRHRKLAYPHVVYLHFLSHPGFAADRLHGISLLDEYEALHPDATEKSVKVAVVNEPIRELANLPMALSTCNKQSVFTSCEARYSNYKYNLIAIPNPIA